MKKEKKVISPNSVLCPVPGGKGLRGTELQGRTVYHVGTYDPDFEHASGESMTVPDQAYSIQELLRKFSNGLDPGVARSPMFAEQPDIDGEDFEKVAMYDPADRQVLREENEEILRSGIGVLKERKRKLKADKFLRQEKERLKRESEQVRKEQGSEKGKEDLNAVA